MSEQTEIGRSASIRRSDETPPFQSRLWLWQVLMLTTLFLFGFPLFLPLNKAIIILLFFIYILAAASFFGEAHRLRNADSDWVPNPWLYLIGYFVLTPLLTVPIYLYRRWRHVGLSL